MSRNESARVPARRPVPANPRRARHAFVFAGILLPAAIVVAGAMTAYIHHGDPLASVVVDENLDGVLDDDTVLFLPLGILLASGLALPAALSLWAAPRVRRGARGIRYRILSALSLGAAVFVTIAMVRMMVPPHAAETWEPVAGSPALPVAAAGGLLAAIAGWAAQPAIARRGERHEPAPGPDEDDDALWERHLMLSTAGLVSLAVVFVLATGAVIGILVIAPAGLLWVAALTALLLTILVLVTNVAFRARVDATGLTLRSAAGWPCVFVPADEIATATVVTVHPMEQFGGWGMRRLPGGRRAVVVRGGPGIEVRLRDGGTVTVTADDAEAGAALLRTLPRRPRGADGRDGEGG
ncbi:hypothetical protein [Microbacterium sp. No. 7]|uniref:hypothetical protein n=1 Tax=Microbacterium sp. No. 7 TaxID=1714373 RepID=UPI0006D0F976|nr:hypothetical protein [Microbacterium sp. No. 7]